VFFKLSKYKGVEIEVCTLSRFRTYFDIDFTWSRNTHHAGFHSYISLFKVSFEFNIYDIRHWDSILNRWESLPKPKVGEKDEWEDQIGI